MKGCQSHCRDSSEILGIDSPVVLSGSVPAHATWNFDAQILDVSDLPLEKNLFAELDTDKDNQCSKAEVLKFLKMQTGESSMPDWFFEAQDIDGN